jgi:hypothetical protein
VRGLARSAEVCWMWNGSVTARVESVRSGQQRHVHSGAPRGRCSQVSFRRVGSDPTTSLLGTRFWYRERDVLSTGMERRRFDRSAAASRRNMARSQADRWGLTLNARQDRVESGTVLLTPMAPPRRRALLASAANALRQPNAERSSWPPRSGGRIFRRVQISLSARTSRTMSSSWL